MILPVYIFDEKVLSQSGKTLSKDYENLSTIISNMFETMYGAGGIGLAAQQVGLSLKLFVIDITNYSLGDKNLETFKKVFINSEVLEFGGEDHKINEGCLSFPGLQIDVIRKEKVKLKYLDENFIEHTEWFDGLASRCIQHEHDHTEGVLFTSRTTPFTRKLVQGKIKDIIKRNFLANYKYKL